MEQQKIQAMVDRFIGKIMNADGTAIDARSASVTMEIDGRIFTISLAPPMRPQKLNASNASKRIMTALCRESASARVLANKAKVPLKDAVEVLEGMVACGDVVAIQTDRLFHGERIVKYGLPT